MESVDAAIAELESTIRGGVAEAAPDAPADKAAEAEKPPSEAQAAEWKREVDTLRSELGSQKKLHEAMETIVYGLAQQQRAGGREERAPAREEAQVTVADLQAAFERDPVNTMLWIQEQAGRRAEAAVEARLQAFQDPQALRKALDPVLREYMGPLVDTHFKVGRQSALEAWAEKNPDVAYARPVLAKVLEEYPEIAQRPDALDMAFKLAKGSGLLEAAPAHGRFLGRSGGGGRAQDSLTEEERTVAKKFGMAEEDYLKFKQQRGAEA